MSAKIASYLYCEVLLNYISRLVHCDAAYYEINVGVQGSAWLVSVVARLETGNLGLLRSCNTLADEQMCNSMRWDYVIGLWWIETSLSGL